MKNIINIAKASFFAALIFAASCKKTTSLNDAAVFIPRESQQVTAFNLQNMMQKADFEAIKQMEFYKAMTAESEKENPILAEILKNPAQSGIDFSKNMYMVTEKGMPMLYISISNMSAFEKMVKEVPISKNGVKVVRNADGFVAWKSDLAILGISAKTDAEEDAALDASFDAEKLFNVKADQSMASNPKFAELMSSKHDMVSYMSLENLGELMGTRLPIGKSELKSSYVSGFGDFENGQMVGKSEFNIAPSLTKDFGIMFKNNVKTDFSKYLTDPNLAFACTFALDTKGIKQILQENSGLEAMLDSKERGFSIDDILKAIDGDMMLSVNNHGGKMSPTLGIKVNDKATAQKFLNTGVQMGALKAEANGAYSLAVKDAVNSKSIDANGQFMFKDDVLFFSDNNAPTGGNTSVVSKALTSNIFALYMNFQQFGGIESEAKALKGTPLTDMRMSINGKTAETVLRTNNPNENVLKSIFQFVNKMYLERKVTAN
ncbi:MAG: hypothetical protein RL757_1776 [Bacteroidota bacterium]